MSVEAISSNSSLYQNNVQSPSQQERKDFMDLSKSLKAGDLAGAQQAFSSLQQDLQAAGQSQDSSVGSDLDNLGKALQSGDLTGAQKAFATLIADIGNIQSTAGVNPYNLNPGTLNGTSNQSVGSLINVSA